MTKKVKFPNFVKDKNLKRLIRMLLRRDPNKRKELTFEKIKSNEVFKGLQWVNLYIMFLAFKESCSIKKVLLSKLIGI